MISAEAHQTNSLMAPMTVTSAAAARSAIRAPSSLPSVPHQVVAVNAAGDQESIEPGGVGALDIRGKGIADTEYAPLIVDSEHLEARFVNRCIGLPVPANVATLRL